MRMREGKCVRIYKGEKSVLVSGVMGFESFGNKLYGFCFFYYIFGNILRFILYMVFKFKSGGWER